MAARSFSCPGRAELVVLSVIRSRNDVVEHPPRWSHGFLEPLIAASTFDHDAPVDRRPHDRSGYLGLTRERSEPIPDRRRERVTELVVTGPRAEVDRLLAFEPAQREPSIRPPRPARPLNGTVAIVAPRASSSRQTDSPNRAHFGPAAAAPDACAMPRVPRACGTARPVGPCTSGTLALATRAPRAGASACASSARMDFGTLRLARPGRSDTTPQATKPYRS